jgi:hypothetical protein
MKPYYTVPELADLTNMTPKGVLNSISRGDFPIPTYKLGKLRVADKQVVEFYFEQKRAEGLSAITTKS